MISDRIKRAREACGISKNMLACRLRITVNELKQYEDNQRTPDSSMLLKLAKVLDVRVSYFFRPIKCCEKSDKDKLNEIEILIKQPYLMIYPVSYSAHVFDKIIEIIND